MSSLSIDEVFERIRGNGRFQMVLLACVCYIYVSATAFHVMVIAFIAGEPTWECVHNSTTCNRTKPVTTVSSHYNDRCSMPRTEWMFSDTYTSTVTEVNIIVPGWRMVVWLYRRGGAILFTFHFVVLRQYVLHCGISCKLLQKCFFSLLLSKP